MCVKSLVNQIVKIEASDILAGNDISVEGENVDITGKDNIYYSTEKHEYKRSGLTVSVGGDTITALTSVAAPAVRAAEVKDTRLKALYGYDAYKQTQTGKVSEEWANLKKGKADISLSVGISTVSSKSESRVTATEAQGSSLAAGNDVNIKTAKDITINGSDVAGQNVTLEAGKELNITVTEEYTKQKTSQTSKGGSIGVSLKAGAITGVEGSLYSAKEKENGETVSYRGSTITAENTMMMESGKNTNIIGSKVSGDKIVADIGGNLNIESLQETNTYREESKSAGISVSTDIGFTQYGTSASAGKGSMRSDYASVQEQAGIYAGKEGFDIHVKDNTNLKGAVIASEADGKKNTLTTGTLSWEDIGNSADYKASGAGISYVSKDSGAKLNEKGLTPDIAPTVKDNEGSMTKSAIAEGTINVTDTENQKQDAGGLNRNTDDSLNRLKEIFDKDSVAEKQELIGMLEKEGDQLIHEYADKKGWKDGSEEKVLLHAAFGTLIGDMSGGSAAGGALAGGVNEYVVGYLEKTKGRDWMEAHSDSVQWISAGVGAAVGAVAGGVSSSASVSAAGTKWNYLGDGHKNIKAIQAGVGVELESGFGHVVIITLYEGNGLEEGNYGRFGGNGEPSSGLHQTPVGNGTYIVDNYFDLKTSDRVIYMLDESVISAEKASRAYNNQILNGGYARVDVLDGNVMGRPKINYYYRIPEKATDYNLLSNNCVTTTIDAILDGQNSWNFSAMSDSFMNGRWDWNYRAEITLLNLRLAKSPAEVDSILRLDYEFYSGKGLVTQVKIGGNVNR